MEELKQYEIDQCQELMDEALIAKSQGDYEAALAKLAEVMQFGVVQADIMYQIADTYFMAEDYERAIVWGKKTIEIDEAYSHAYWLIALAYYKLNDMKRMLITLNAGLEQGDMAEYRDIFANILADKHISKKYEKFLTVKCPQVKKELFSKKTKQHIVKANKIEESVREPKENQQIAENCPAVSTRMDYLLNKLAIMQQSDTELAGQLAAVEETGLISPETMDYFSNFSSDEILREVFNGDDIVDKQYVLNIVATGYFAVGNYECALHLLLKAVEVCDDTLTFKNLAAVLCQLGETELAAKYLKKIGSQDIMALNLLGQIKAMGNK